LIRHLAAEGTSFQRIKDNLRRDIAIRDLAAGDKSIEAIAQDVGFASTANFHRAFKQWTSMTPGAYRTASSLPMSRASGSLQLAPGPWG